MRAPTRTRRPLARLRDPDLPDGALRVSLADKLHNARAILADLRAGRDVFARFNAPRDDQAWYYRALVATFAERAPGPMADELGRVVDEVFAPDSG